MKNLNITISFDTLKRLYQFSMYYLAQYQQMLEDTNKKEPSKDIVLPKNKKEYLNTMKEKKRRKTKMEDTVNSFSKSLKTDLKLQLNNYLEKLNNRKENPVENAFDKWKSKIRDEKSGKLLKREKIKNTMRVKFIMNNTNFKVPLYPQNKDTPIVTFFFNMIYNQDWTNDYENIYTIPNKKILETIYYVQDSKMNVIVNKLNLEVSFPTDKIFSFLMKKKLPVHIYAVGKLYLGKRKH